MVATKSKHSPAKEKEALEKKGFKVGMKVHMTKSKGRAGKIVEIFYPEDDKMPPMVVYKKHGPGEELLYRNRPSILSPDKAVKD